MADGGGGRQLFRKKSLERLSSPERLDQLLNVVDQKSWVPLVTLGALIFLLLLWSVLGDIPVYVEGKGIIMRPRAVVEWHSRGLGKLRALEVEVGDDVQKGDVIALIARPELEKRLELQRSKLRVLENRSLQAEGLRDERTTMHSDSSRFERESLSDQIRTLEQIADDLKNGRLRSIEQDERSLIEQIDLSKRHCDSTAKLLESQRRLHGEGILSEMAVEQAQTDHLDGLDRLADLERELRSLRTEKLEVEENYVNRLQRITELRLQLQQVDLQEKQLQQENLESAGSYEQQIADLKQEIGELDKLLDEEGRVVAEHAGRVLEISVAVGEVVVQGQRLGAMRVHRPDRALQSVAFFRVKDGKRVLEGSKIQVTPDTVERERYGSIKGNVYEVSPLPVTLEEVESVVGNRAVAEYLTSGEYLMAVSANLETSSETPSGFAWTSSRGPDIDITAGTTATVRVAVEEHMPITFVVPFLKAAAGID